MADETQQLASITALFDAQPVAGSVSDVPDVSPRVLDLQVTPRPGETFDVATARAVLDINAALISLASNPTKVDVPLSGLESVISSQVAGLVGDSGDGEVDGVTLMLARQAVTLDGLATNLLLHAANHLDSNNHKQAESYTKLALETHQQARVTLGKLTAHRRASAPVIYNQVYGHQQNVFVSERRAVQGALEDLERYRNTH